ncbi:MAG: DUF6431 domain-containing protein [Lachnospiraceae bacterium]|nr:DUF6431 domain-containing protein [Lachnospiraceae bacterium]
MINVKCLLGKLFLIHRSDIELFHTYNSQKISGNPCPICGHSSGFADHSWYERDFVYEDKGVIKNQRVKIRIVRCKYCSKLHSILPDVAVPFSSFSLLFILKVIRAYLMKKDTVSNICERWQIAPATLYSWVRRFHEQFRAWQKIVSCHASDPIEFVFQTDSFPELFRKTAGYSFMSVPQRGCSSDTVIPPDS